MEKGKVSIYDPFVNAYRQVDVKHAKRMLVEAKILAEKINKLEKKDGK
jgi:hypothetical protein